MPNLYTNTLWVNEAHIIDFDVGEYTSGKWQIGTSITYSGIKTNKLEVDETITVKDLAITGKLTGITIPDKIWITKKSPTSTTNQNTALSSYRGKLWCYYHGTPVDQVQSTTTTVTPSDPKTVSKIITNTYKGDSSYSAKNWIYHGAGSSKPTLSVTATTKNSCFYYKDNTSTTTSTITGGTVKTTTLKDNTTSHITTKETTYTTLLTEVLTLQVTKTTYT